MTNPLKFYQDLQTIRLTASVLYDRGRSMDRSHEQLADDIAPLKTHQSAFIQHAVKTDLGGVICAIRQLQADAKAHLEAAEFLREKAADSRAHATALMDALKNDLKENNSTERLDNDFSVTLVNDEITIR